VGQVQACEGAIRWAVTMIGFMTLKLTHERTAEAGATSSQQECRCVAWGSMTARLPISCNLAGSL
jgi:hypothetical protein